MLPDRPVRILVVTSRRPWPPHSGDRLRALLWIEALAGHEVTLVTPAGAATAEPGAARVVEVARPPWSLAAAAAAAVARGLPLHTLLAAGAWRQALARAAEGGTFDVAIVLLSRLVPWLPELPARRRVLDAIDSAAAGMEERARAARGPARLFWRREARAAARLEAAAARQWDRVAVVSADEAARFGDRAAVLPVGIELPPPAPAAGRRTDFVFWGRLPYFANRRALRLLLDRVWPRVRALRPAATLVVGGAEAPGWLAARDGRDGVSVVSPIADRDALLAGVRVALLPVAHGTGQSLKTLEAAAAGCAVAGTRRAFRGCAHLAAAAVVEDDPERLAERAVDLVASGAWEEAGRALRELVAAHDARPALLARMAALVEEVA